jgi:type IV pilus assembly protein PilA
MVKQARNLKALQSEKGFSLVELMIVVAIIGILATIAIPNFNRFQVKARQGEAKTNLAGLYNSEKTFFAEWNGYWADFRDIGYSPEGKLHYHVGFGAAGSYNPGAPFNASVQGGGANTAFNTSVSYALAGGLATPPAGLSWVATGASGCATGSTVPSQTAFTASANSSPALIGGTANDAWTIDEKRALCNNVSAI